MSDGNYTGRFERVSPNLVNETLEETIERVEAQLSANSRRL